MQNVSASNVKIGGSHGYRIEGDVAFLNAEVDVASPNLEGTQWALQLWACNEPYWGGPIFGMKVAEAPVSFPGHAGLNRVAAEAIVSAPAMRGDYSMVLVVTSRSADALDQVHDFANYAARESFVAPHLDGAVGYAIDGDWVVLKAGRVVNPRPTFSLNGALTLELWALPQPFRGGALDGARLASAELGVVGGSCALVEQDLRVPFTPPPAGEWHIVMVLREQLLNANATRDFCNFEVTFRSPAAAPAVAKPAALEPVASEKSKPAPQVSVQNATLDALMQVKGISRKLAVEIIRSRPFQSLEDLLRVRGIGENLLRKLKPFLTL